MGKKAHVIYLIANCTGQSRASLRCRVTMKSKSHVVPTSAIGFLNAWRLFIFLGRTQIFETQ